MEIVKNLSKAMCSRTCTNKALPLYFPRLGCLLFVAGLWSNLAAAQTADLTSPREIHIDDGGCLHFDDGSVSANWTNTRRGITLAFTIGPSGTGMLANMTPRNTEPYRGAGAYDRVLISFIEGTNIISGLGKVMIGPDLRTGHLQSNDGRIAGEWSCGKALPGLRSSKGGTQQSSEPLFSGGVIGITTDNGKSLQMAAFTRPNFLKDDPLYAMLMNSEIKDKQQLLLCKYGPKGSDPNSPMPHIWYWYDSPPKNLTQLIETDKDLMLHNLGNIGLKSCPPDFQSAKQVQKKSILGYEKTWNSIYGGQ